MLKTPLLDASAPWKQRFRAPVVPDARMAMANPTRGIAVSNITSDAFQVYTCASTWAREGRIIRKL
jgi:hypothetical protein